MHYTVICHFLLLFVGCVLLVKCQDIDEIPIHDVIPADETDDTLPPDPMMTDAASDGDGMGHASEFPSGLSTTPITTTTTQATTTSSSTTTTTATPPTTRITTTTIAPTTTERPSSLQRATALHKENVMSTAVWESHLRARDEEIESLRGTMDETNKRLLLLLEEKDRLSSALNQATADIAEVRAQVNQELSVIQRFMRNASSETESQWQSLRKEMRDEFEILRQQSEARVEASKSESDQQILVNNRIIVISLAVVSVPISFLLILILYLTLRRDKKIVKSEQRLALNEMNHLRRYNDY